MPITTVESENDHTVAGNPLERCSLSRMHGTFHLSASRFVLLVIC